MCSRRVVTKSDYVGDTQVPPRDDVHYLDVSTQAHYSNSFEYFDWTLGDKGANFALSKISIELQVTKV